MATLKIHGLGDYIRDQRVLSQISLRQLARQAGVSNPYLSQIERGLRKPSAEILQQIAKALRISAEALYIQAGILDERDAEGTVPAAVLSDATISERQKQVLLEIYDSFRKENDAATPPPSAVADDAAAAVVAAVTTPVKAAKTVAKAATAKATKAAPKKTPARKPAASPAPPPAPAAAPDPALPVTES